MSSQKKRLQAKAAKFRKENPALHTAYRELISSMARYILKSSAPEVVVGIKHGWYYEHAIN